MYEDQTYEVIMTRLLSNVSPDVDKSEGSFIWDALSPAALELAQAYIAIDSAKDQSYVGTATGAYLDRGVAEMGVNRTAASYAGGEVTLTGTVGSVIAAGTLPATSSGTQFVTTADATIGADGTITSPINAVLPGVSGNVPAGAITVIPISVSGLTSVTNAAATYGGEDEESDDDLRTRYFNEISQRAESGNSAQFTAWATGFAGIGRSKVFPLWNGVNTVKVSILDANNAVASQELVDSFQTYMDPGKTGLGNGVAPIGAVVTITTATAITLNIAASVVLTAGYTVPTGVQEAIEAYFAALSYTKTSVSYLGLAAKIQDVPSVESLSGLTINSGTVDISLGVEQIPILGTYSCQVVAP